MSFPLRQKAGRLEPKTLIPATLTAAPLNPSYGMIALADGSNWDPVSSGTPTLVYYDGTSWVGLIGGGDSSVHAEYAYNAVIAARQTMYDFDNLPASMVGAAAYEILVIGTATATVEGSLIFFTADNAPTIAEGLEYVNLSGATLTTFIAGSGTDRPFVYRALVKPGGAFTNALLNLDRADPGATLDITCSILIRAIGTAQ